MYDNYRSLLNEFIALKSISTDPAYLPEMTRTADWLRKQFERRGFTVTILEDGSCNPVVVARYDAGKADTVLIYGHYDVQPAVMEQGWSTDPFAVRESDGRLFGRGVVDNKGQVLIHIVSVFEHIANGTLRSNITFMIEGNEETGNTALGRLVEQHKDLLDCTEIMVSDGEIMGDTPAIESSLRGGCNIRVRIRTGRTDLHSGLAGGAVPSASTVLTHLLANLIDERGRVLVPGFYDDMQEVSDTERSSGAELQARENPAETLGVSQLLSANGTDFFTQTGLYPTVQISGIATGYTGEGFANIVPATAEARLNVRTAPGQDSQAVAQALETYIRETTPGYAQIEIDTIDPHPPVVMATDTPAAKRAATILTTTYGKQPVNIHVGGAIPVVHDLQRIFRVDPLLCSLGNDDCNMHGADENFRIDLIQKGLEFSRAYLGGD